MTPMFLINAQKIYYQITLFKKVMHLVKNKNLEANTWYILKNSKT